MFRAKHYIFLSLLSHVISCFRNQVMVSVYPHYCECAEVVLLPDYFLCVELHSDTEFFTGSDVSTSRNRGDSCIATPEVRCKQGGCMHPLVTVHGTQGPHCEILIAHTYERTQEPILDVYFLRRKTIN